MSDSSDRAEVLVREIKAGNCEGFSSLAELCIFIPPEIAKAAAGLGFDPEDLWQEASIALINAIHAYDEDREAGFRTFSSVCIRKKLLSIVRSGYRQKNMAMVGYESLDSVSIASDSNPENEYIRKEENQSYARTLLEGLSPFENSVITLYLRNMSYAQIAGRLGRDEKSVGNALGRVRQKLRMKEIRKDMSANA